MTFAYRDIKNRKQSCFVVLENKIHQRKYIDTFEDEVIESQVIAYTIIFVINGKTLD